jgi:hypothetical protein
MTRAAPATVNAPTTERGHENRDPTLSMVSRRSAMRNRRIERLRHARVVCNELRRIAWMDGSRHASPAPEAGNSLTQGERRGHGGGYPQLQRPKQQAFYGGMSTAMHPFRKRLLVVLGAGSTIHAGAPSTPAITSRVCRIPDEPIWSVVAWLRTQRGKDGFNFETVLACLEELDEFSLREKVPQAWDRIGGVLSAFADFKADFATQAKGSFLTARWDLINGLSHFVIAQTRNSQLEHLKKLLID